MIAVQENVSLKKYNTFGVDQKAKYLSEIGSERELLEVLDMDKFKQIPKLILGGGSNVLFIHDYPGLVIVNQIKGITVTEESSDYIWLKVGSGEIWQDLVDYAVAKNLGGIENLSLIPGTVGASPVQNIGAYGVEAKETIQNVKVAWLENGKIQSFDNSQCQFGYRDSVFKGKLKGLVVILSVTFRLQKNPTSFRTDYGDITKTLQEMNIQNPDIKDISRAVVTIRQAKLPDPTKTPNAGSFFKNPEIPQELFEKLKTKFESIKGYSLPNNNIKIPAGWLIENCGLKGYREGKVGVHPKQSLVLVNYGRATGQEILDLAKKVQQTVTQKFGINLEMEVNLIG
jgi:UDP-N-acetylmuramate dehydrogenase